MQLRHFSIVTASVTVLLLAPAWMMTAQSEDKAKTKKEAYAAKPAGKKKKEAYANRFDKLVREDLFAGFSGDEEAFKRGLKTCEDMLAKNPRHPEALVWRGAARVFMSRKAFVKGDQVTGIKLWTAGIKDMDEAIKIAPDNIGVLIPRAAVMLPAGRNAPPVFGKPLLVKVRTDLERTYKRQKEYLHKLGEHPQGELRMALADVYRLLDQPEKSKEQLEAVVKSLPDSAYAERAKKWLKAAPDKKLAHNCIGCHSK